MPLFGSRTEKLIFIFDIGSSSVGGAALLVRDGDVPVITALVRTSIPLPESIKFDRFLTLVERGLSETTVRLLRKTRRRPDEVHCFLAAPWYASQTRKVSIARERPFVFDQKALDASVRKELELFLDEALDSESRLLRGARIIEDHVIGITANGYAIDKPVGKKVTHADYALFVAVVPERVMDGFTATLHRQIPGAHVRFHSFLLPFYATARSIFTEKDDFLLMEIGGEVTDVALVRDGTLLQSASFPLGRNFLIRRLTSALNKPVTEAHSTITMLLEGKLDKKTEEELRKTLAPIRDEWLREFRAVITEKLRASFLPDEVILLSGADVAGWFKSAIEREEYAPYTLSAKPFAVSTPAGNALGKFIKADATITERDQFLSMEAVYLHRFRAGSLSNG